MSAGGPGSARRRSIFLPFRDAFRGIWLAYREERHLRFHVFAASCAAVAACGARLSGWEVAYLAATVALVLLAEVINTAVERAVDLAVGSRRLPLAGMAKDAAAGAVLLAALHAVFAAVFLFLVERSLAETLSGVRDLLAARPWVLAVPAAAGLMALFGGKR